MANFHQKLDSVRDSLASLFSRSSRRRRRSGGGGASSISTPQNVRRVMHITFDANNKSFEGIPQQWRQHFEPPSSSSASFAAMTASQEEQKRSRDTLLEDQDGAGNDDSGVAMTTPPPPPQPKELLSLTYNKDTGRFVDLPEHWQDRLRRNNLLDPEFQKNPDQLVAIFALMDEELRAMEREGFPLDRGLYSSLPAATASCHQPPDGAPSCQFVYEIEADKSNSSSEQDLLPETCSDSCSSSSGGTRQHQQLQEAAPSARVRRPSLVTMRAVAAPVDDAL